MSEANFCDGSGKPKPAFRYLKLSQLETNTRVNSILKNFSELWSIAGNRKAAISRLAYILRYSIAKLYAAKFKLKTVAKVFKLGGNNLSKPLGVKSKSIIGVCEEYTYPNSKKMLTGILFDRYYKIPKPMGNKLSSKWMPEYIKALKNEDSLKNFIQII